MNPLLVNDPPYSVLFIGNSYTYYNDMPTIFADIAAEQGIPVNVASVTKGGYTLQKLADPNDKYGKLANDILCSQRFDVTFLQEQSLRPIVDHEKFLDGAKLLDARIRQNGSKTVLYQTWGRNSDSQDLRDLNLTTRSMSEKLSAAYKAVAKELSCTVSPVGDAFLYVSENYPSVELYNPDNSHPSLIGSALAALCHYVTIFGKLSSPPSIENISPSVMYILTSAANNTLNN